MEDHDNELEHYESELKAQLQDARDTVKRARKDGDKQAKVNTDLLESTTIKFEKATVMNDYEKPFSWAKIQGSSFNGSPRFLTVTVSKGKMTLRINPPDSNNGYSIKVDAEELLDALKNVEGGTFS